MLGILKYMIFAVMYLLSARKFRYYFLVLSFSFFILNIFRFWIMPNLTKDVGFLASFWPLYEYTYTGEVIEEEAEDAAALFKSKVKTADAEHEDSDSNESGKSGFEFLEKNKDE